jgi:molybdopterin converting factor subunit 1
MGQVKIEYFAVLKEQAGREREDITVAEGANVVQIYETLARRHNFSVRSEYIRAAVNDAFVSADHIVQPGDKVVFIPPVSGG